jgi:hypothetical protein
MTYRLYAPSHHRSEADLGVFLLREVFFLVGDEESILWSDASNSPVRLPDSRARWNAIWSRRDRIVEIAHSHPIGPLAFSREDETTMDALSSALGRELTFSVIAGEGMIRTTLRPSLEKARAVRAEVRIVTDEPWWTTVLRLASGVRTSAAEPSERTQFASEARKT